MSTYRTKRRQRNFVRSQIFTLLLVIFLFSGVSQTAYAQMFSVDDDAPGAFDRPSVAIFAGLEPIEFSYEGEDGTRGAGAYEFSGNLLRFRLESFGANIYLGFGGGATGLDEDAYFDAGIRYGYGLSLYRSQDFSLQLPLVLHSSFTSVSNDDVIVVDMPQFQQGTFEVGGGLSINAQIAPRFRLGIQAIPSYGFSFSTREQDASGSVAAMKGEGRLYFNRLFGNAGLSLGYDYNYRRFDIEGNPLDYSASAHSILIGITF